MEVRKVVISKIQNNILNYSFPNHKKYLVEEKNIKIMLNRFLIKNNNISKIIDKITIFFINEILSTILSSNPNYIYKNQCRNAFNKMFYVNTNFKESPTRNIVMCSPNKQINPKIRPQVIPELPTPDNFTL